MKLYHGSKLRLVFLVNKQATGEVIEGKVVADELLNGIYLTPDYGFAVAMAARPEGGATEIDDEARKITFEDPGSFDPERDIFIYSFDSESLASENVKHIDKWQTVVVGVKELRPESVEQMKARKVLEYYELVNWKGKEPGQEITGGMKFR